MFGISALSYLLALQHVLCSCGIFHAPVLEPENQLFLHTLVLFIREYIGIQNLSTLGMLVATGEKLQKCIKKIFSWQKRVEPLYFVFMYYLKFAKLHKSTGHSKMYASATLKNYQHFWYCLTYNSLFSSELF